MEHLDLENRDPQSINDHVMVSFEDVLAEPAGTHSFACCWKASYCCFTCGKECLYKFLTTLFGMCIALQWGCEFALVSFNMVWYFTPALRMCSIYAGCCQKFYGTCMMCCLAPLCESLGLFFSRITVTNKSG